MGGTCSMHEGDRILLHAARIYFRWNKDMSGTYNALSMAKALKQFAVNFRN